MHNGKILLVGDNPFHGVSHLSQGRARERSYDITNPENCAGLVSLAMENGADGFMFSISETTLSILKLLRRSGKTPRLYAIAPAASDYVRLASNFGTPGLAAYLAKQVIISGNIKATAYGVNGIMAQNPVNLMKAYIFHELYRIESAIITGVNPYCFMLHEIVTDMSLALDLKWLFKSYVDFMLTLKIKPGFETRNFPYLIDKFTKWGIDLDKVALVTPFNEIGFQMSPSKTKCERTLESIPKTEAIAMSILASGHIMLSEAIAYLKSIPQISGVVVGVSKEKHAHDFKILRDALAAL